MKILIAIALAVGGFVAWYFMTRGSGGRMFGGVAAPPESQVWLGLYGYVATVCGVFLGSGYRALEAMRARNETEVKDFKHFFTSFLRSIDFWMAMFASPIVYAMIWKTFNQQDFAALSIVALENGFACLAVVSSLLKNKS